MKSSTQDTKILDNATAEVNHNLRYKLLSSRSIWRIYIAYLVFNDIFMTVQAFRLAYVIRFKISLPVFEQDALDSFPYYSSLTIVLVPIWLVIFAASGLYTKQKLLGGVDEYQTVGRATTIGMLCLVVFGFLDPKFIVARGWLLLVWWFSLVFVVFGRFLLRRGVYILRRRGYFVSPAVIVGANDEGMSLARQILDWRTSGLDIVGFVDKKLKPGTVVCNNLRVLGPVEELDEIIATHSIEELILAASAISTHDKLLDIFQRYGVNDNVNVRMSSGLYEILTTGLTVKEFAYVPLVGVNKVRLTVMDRLLKLLFDYALTIPGLLVFSPLLGMIAIAIKLDSPGPAIYRRRVMGVNGKEFDAFKFRTMLTNGEEILSGYPELQAELAQHHKIKNDPRITRIGRFLRKHSLDELPQLINILRGEMSFVGPRMISPKEMKKYSQWGINLLTIKPGITGLWQVSGRSDISYEERVRLDMHYIRNWSIWLDLQLLWRTVPAVLLSQGAY